MCSACLHRSRLRIYVIHNQDDRGTQVGCSEASVMTIRVPAAYDPSTRHVGHSYRTRMF